MLLPQALSCGARSLPGAALASGRCAWRTARPARSRPPIESNATVPRSAVASARPAPPGDAVGGRPSWGDDVASVAECERAFHALAERLAGADADTRSTASFDRSLSCALPDLGVIFAGRLQDGTLTDIRRVDSKEAQVRLSMSSDDLIRLVAGELHLGSAWASGRVKVHASVFDLIKLRTIF